MVDGVPIPSFSAHPGDGGDAALANDEENAPTEEETTTEVAAATEEGEGHDSSPMAPSTDLPTLLRVEAALTLRSIRTGGSATRKGDAAADDGITAMRKLPTLSAVRRLVRGLLASPSDPSPASMSSVASEEAKAEAEAKVAASTKAGGSIATTANPSPEDVALFDLLLIGTPELYRLRVAGGKSSGVAAGTKATASPSSSVRFERVHCEDRMETIRTLYRARFREARTLPRGYAAMLSSRSGRVRSSSGLEEKEVASGKDATAATTSTTASALHSGPAILPGMTLEERVRARSVHRRQREEAREGVFGSAASTDASLPPNKRRRHGDATASSSSSASRPSLLRFADALRSHLSQRRGRASVFGGGAGGGSKTETVTMHEIRDRLRGAVPIVPATTKDEVDGGDVDEAAKRRTDSRSKKEVLAAVTDLAAAVPDWIRIADRRRFASRRSASSPSTAPAALSFQDAIAVVRMGVDYRLIRAKLGGRTMKTFPPKTRRP